uniref:Major facilitator superfamily (MFS) profile domain-containing protein n=1 Tax=Haptolina ericina TaxID=156174 RepID=A0A7S3B538_9EUKA|mmetsp:Transcript_48237/g.108642  ORF Transcript_48237/g.108642 Transcript_48237/m.108642 type:complete len:300 (+) Transcript_48237:170-1069(+)
MHEESGPLLPLKSERGALDAVEAHPRGNREELPGSFMLSLLYWGVYVANGGLVGALGPSLESFERATGLSEAAMGRLVMQNRIAKVIGVGIWTIYMKRFGTRSWLRPHWVIGMAVLCVAISNAVIAHMQNFVVAIRCALIVAGLSYGISDSGTVQLTLYRWNHSDRHQRTAVAVLNMAFTVGALATPILVALSLRLYGHSHLAFDAITVVALIEAVLLPFYSSPNHPANQMTNEQAGGLRPKHGLSRNSQCAIFACLVAMPPSVSRPIVIWRVVSVAGPTKQFRPEYELLTASDPLLSL